MEEKKPNHVSPFLIALVLVMLFFAGCTATLLVGAGRAFKQWDMGARLWAAALVERDLRKSKALLEEGADPNWTGEGNLLVAAIEEKNEPLLRLLLSYGAEPDLALCGAWKSEQAHRLLALGADPNAYVCYDGEHTPLMAKALDTNADMVRFLLKNGADSRLTAKDGRTIREMVDYAKQNQPELAARYDVILQMISQAQGYR